MNGASIKHRSPQAEGDLPYDIAQKNNPNTLAQHLRAWK